MPHQVRAERRPVQIEGDDFRFGQLPFHLQGAERFDALGHQSPWPRAGQPDELHRQRGRPGYPAQRGRRLLARPRHREDVHAGMTPEPLVLGRHHGLGDPVVAVIDISRHAIKIPRRESDAQRHAVAITPTGTGRNVIEDRLLKRKDQPQRGEGRDGHGHRDQPEPQDAPPPAAHPADDEGAVHFVMIISDWLVTLLTSGSYMHSAETGGTMYLPGVTARAR